MLVSELKLQLLLIYIIGNHSACCIHVGVLTLYTLHDSDTQFGVADYKYNNHSTELMGM